MKRRVGNRPCAEGSTVPIQGKNWAVEPVLSSCHSALSVSWVAALGRQVSDGMNNERSSGTC